MIFCNVCNLYHNDKCRPKQQIVGFRPPDRKPTFTAINTGDQPLEKKLQLSDQNQAFKRFKSV